MKKILGILSISVAIVGIVCVFLFFQLTSIQSQINELNNQNSELENPFNIYKEIVILNEGRTDNYIIVNRDWWVFRKDIQGALNMIA